MPFSFVDAGVIRLELPEDGWPSDDRTSFMRALTRSCAEGPTGVLLDSGLRSISVEGPSMMIDMFNALRDQVTCIGLTTATGDQDLTVMAFRATATLIGLRIPIVTNADHAIVERAVVEHTRVARVARN
jgi:hypothetical protein